MGLNIQKFLEKDKNNKELLSEAPLHLDVLDYPDENLLVLNYNQIESPKFDPIAKECRGLILDNRDFSVVARSFDRFFNFGECPASKDCDISKGRVFEKIDGSLVTFYNFKRQWNVSTRKRAFAEGGTANGETFEQKISKVFNRNEILKKYPKEFSFVMEFVSPETRVVTPYPTPKLYLLSIRDNSIGKELPYEEVMDISRKLGLAVPKSFQLNSFDEIIAASKELPIMEEGYVCVWESGDSFYRLKIKNPSYLAIAHMRDNGGVASENRMIELIFSNDTEEYFSYFPEDREIFQPYVEAFETLKTSVSGFMSQYGKMENQKDFAMLAKDLPYSGILFSMKKGFKLENIFERMSDNSKREILKSLVNSNAPTKTFSP